MSNMLMARRNKARIRHLACCDWDDPASVPSGRILFKRALKRRERNAWKSEARRDS